ncbi:MAG: PASTA domain-containing protein [Spirochaetaceae bacterium]|nr:PASTA domain-containing protein [Spirochaetaceae bacterium]
MKGFIPKNRFIVFFVLVGIVVIYIIAVYAFLAFRPINQISPESKEFTRGTIADRNGRPLAVSTNFYHLSVTPDAVVDVIKAAELLAPVLEMDALQIVQEIQDAKRVFYLKKHLDENQYDRVKRVISSENLSGFRFDKIPGRLYPENDLAAQLLGFMGDDGEGLAGIEYSMQSTLAPQLSTDVESSRPGLNVYLTIDANLQYKLEKIAQEAMDTTQAESVMMVAADAKSGEILSYISLPSVNLNEYRTSTVDERQDRPAVIAYEPGSVFKIFSVATFIDAGVIDEDDIFVCDGKFEVKSSNGELIRITCLEHHGALTAREALQYSCNDALAQMSSNINADYFIAKLRQLGFGSKTGVELPSETTGIVKSTTDKLWSARSKPTISIGQEISVSALQMVQATTALANDGVPVKLSFISRVTDQNDNTVYSRTPIYGERVFKSSTADYLLSCMESTAKSGTGHRAALGDISIGVKTGTAQMADIEHGGYSETDFLSNCVAVFPIEDPKIILYIVITKAQGETYAGRIVAPVVGDVADVIIDHMGLSREGAATLAHSGRVSVSTGQLPEIDTYLPNYLGVPKRLLTNLLLRTDLNIKITGDGYVVAQNPPAGTPITEGMTIEFYLE